jgi:hypothetical protein
VSELVEDMVLMSGRYCLSDGREKTLFNENSLYGNSLSRPDTGMA